MRRLIERYPELRGEDGDAIVERIVADLEQAYTSTMPANRRARIAHTLGAMPHTAVASSMARPYGATRPSSHLLARGKRRLVTWAIAVLIVLSGFVGYFQVNAPTPVSAQMVLRRAVAALPTATPQQVFHIVDRFHDVMLRPGPHGTTVYVTDETSDLWVQQDIHGLVTRLDWTQRRIETGIRGVRLLHTVAAGLTRATYDGQTRTATITTHIAPTAPERRADPHVANLVSMLRAAQRGTSGNVHLLGQQTLNGRRVYAVIFRPSPAAGGTITCYIDAHTYALWGVDATTVDVAGNLVASQTMRVLQYTSVPLSAVPTGVFTFTPPAGTTVHTHRYRAGEQQWSD